MNCFTFVFEQHHNNVFFDIYPYSPKDLNYKNKSIDTLCYQKNLSDFFITDKCLVDESLILLINIKKWASLCKNMKNCAEIIMKIIM